MAAGADVVAVVAAGDGLFNGRPLFGLKAFIAIELIGRGGVSEPEEFTVRIGPAVFAAAFHIKRTNR